MSIRAAVLEDLPQILAIYAPYVENTTVSFEYTPPTLEEFTARFTSITAQFPWLVWEEDGRILGYAYGSPPFHRAAYQWCGEASIYLHPDARRRGIGKALYTVLEEIMKRQGYHKVYAIITEQNHASLSFHRAMGYSFVANFPKCGFKHGQWIGITWLEKPLILSESPSNPPLPAQSIVNNHRIFTEILDKIPLS